MNYEKTIRSLDWDIERLKAQLMDQDRIKADIERLTDARDALQEMAASPHAKPSLRSGGGGTKRKPAKTDAELMAATGAPNVCDRAEGSHGPCGGEIHERSCTVVVDGKPCQFVSRRCDRHGGRRAANATCIGHHTAHRTRGHLD
jgi:hypothetical protein